MNMMLARLTPGYSEPDCGDRILFASDDLMVRRVARGTGDICYVTFDSYTDHFTLDRPGFGEVFFRSRAIDAIHVVSRDNQWYQYDELADALAAIRAATRGYAQVIAYGSSMGGFAALRYGRACGAGIGIAISPQFSVDPAVAPFEWRWAPEIAHIRFRGDMPAPLPLQYILYDPRDRCDRQHFELFATRSPSVAIEIPNGGHPVAGCLAETALFEPMFDAIHAGIFEPTSFTRELRRRRRQSGQYLFTLAQRIPAYRMKQKIALARMAVSAHVDHPVYLSYYATVLDSAGRHAAARASHDRAVEISADGLHPLHNLMLHHEMLGELDEARRIVDALIARFPDVRMLHESRARLIRRERRATLLGRLAWMLRIEPLLDRLRTAKSPLKACPAE